MLMLIADIDADSAEANYAGADTNATTHIGADSCPLDVVITPFLPLGDNKWSFDKQTLSHFLSDPGVPRVRSMGPVVSH